MTQPPADLIITGCTVLVHDDHEEIGFAEDASIVVRGGVIEAITDDVRDLDAGERIDARGQVASPRPARASGEVLTYLTYEVVTY
ncbi:hypothetical protein [Streptomyces sp. NBC_00996]|uniref:hypothetical protein n=1 Tax=Streptomyces sp. NBC_00996 TaxID=2903710 RepID=UPI0038640D29